MKICFIFRGENMRTKRNIMLSPHNIENWKETLFNPCKDHTVDTALITYKSGILELLTSMMLPKYVLVNPMISQNENMKDVATFMKEKQNEYDRFVIVRFDIVYKLKITDWPNWDKHGILITNRDVHWVREQLYADALFIVDSPMVSQFQDAVYATPADQLPHYVGKYLYLNKIPFHLMYNEFYHMESHPLHAFAQHGTEINYSFKEVLDISKYKGEKSELKVITLVIATKEIFYKKLAAINYFIKQYEYINFRCDYKDTIQEIYKGPQFLFESIKISDDEIDLEYFNLSESDTKTYEFQPLRYVAGGLLGDFNHSLSVVCEMFHSTGRKGIVYLSHNMGGDNFRFGLETAFLDTKDLVISQEYIQEYKVYNGESFDINLNTWRKNPLLYKASWYDIFKSEYTVEWGTHPWMNVPENPEFANCILISVTNAREITNIDWSQLSNTYAGSIYFISQNEHDYLNFVLRFGLMFPFIKVKNLFELVRAISSCKLFIGGLSSPLTFAFATRCKCIPALSIADGDSIHNLTLDKYIPSIYYSLPLNI